MKCIQTPSQVLDYDWKLNLTEDLCMTFKVINGMLLGNNTTIS